MEEQAAACLQQCGSALGAAPAHSSPVHGELTFYSTLAADRRGPLSAAMLVELQQVCRSFPMLYRALVLSGACDISQGRVHVMSASSRSA